VPRTTSTVVNRSEAPISASVMTCVVRVAPLAVGPRLGVDLAGDQDAVTRTQGLGREIERRT